MFELIQLRRERLDLLDLVVDHLDVFGDFLRRIENLLRVNSRLVYDPLRLKPGDKVKYRELKGLHPEDAYLLATRLLGSLDIDSGRIPYAGLRDLLAQLDHHPLAIQLVLPALQDVPVAEIRADFGALLPRFDRARRACGCVFL